MLTRQVEDGPAGDHEAQSRSGSEEVADDRCRSGQLLEVVEHEQDTLTGQQLDQELEWRSDAALDDPDRPGDRARHQERVVDRLERHEERPVGEIGSRLVRELDREAGLADPARPADGQEAGRPEEPSGLAEIALATDERRERHRQVVRPRVDGPQGRKVADQSVHHQLAQPRRLPKVTQPVGTQISPAHTGRKRFADQPAGRRRDHDLATVTGCRDPCRAVDVDPDVALADPGHLAGMDPDPDADGSFLGPRLGGQPELALDGRPDSLRGTREHHEE